MIFSCTLNCAFLHHANFSFVVFYRQPRLWDAYYWDVDDVCSERDPLCSSPLGSILPPAVVNLSSFESLTLRSIGMDPTDVGAACLPSQTQTNAVHGSMISHVLMLNDSMRSIDSEQIDENYACYAHRFGGSIQRYHA